MTPDLRELLGHRSGWRPKRPPSPPTVIPQRPPDADQWARQDTIICVAVVAVAGILAGTSWYLCLR